MITADNEQDEFLRSYGKFYSTVIKKPGTDFIFKRSSLPSVHDPNLSRMVTDPDILKMDRSLIQDILPHRHKLFWGDNTATTFAKMTTAIIVGENIIITCDDLKAKDIIDSWNDDINASHQTIENFMTDAFFDNLIDAQSLWRVYQDNTQDEPIVDLARVSMAHIQKEKHPTLGYMRFIQRTAIPIYTNSKQEFYRRDPHEHLLAQYRTVIIPNELNCCVYVKLFKKPPVSPILPLLNMKRWAYWFLRKFMEKHWAPFILAYVGDPANGYMPNDPQELKESLQWAAQQIRQIRDFSGAAFPATMKIEAMDVKTKKGADVFLDTLQHLSKEIAIGMYSTITLVEDSGKAKPEVAQEGYLRTIRSFREIYSILLRKFYATVLLPAHNINAVKPRDIKISFPPLKTDKIKDIVESVEIAARIGAFKDWVEIRKILNPIWKHIDENITDAEGKAMKDLFIELNAPSRGEGDAPQQRASGSKAKPKK